MMYLCPAVNPVSEKLSEKYIGPCILYSPSVRYSSAVTSYKEKNLSVVGFVVNAIPILLNGESTGITLFTPP